MAIEITTATELQKSGIRTALAVAGTGTTNTFSELQTFTSASASGAIALTPTWNNGAAEFNMVYGRATDTASSSSSNLLNLGTVASGMLLRLRKDGLLYNSGHQTLGAASGYEVYAIGSSGAESRNVSAGRSGVFTYSGITLQSGGYIGWNSVAAATGNDAANPGNNDLYLRRHAANTLAQRNSTNAQTLQVYRSYTDDSNHERLALQSGSGYFEVAAETAGTGTENIDLKLTPAGTGYVQFGTHSAVGAETVTGFITIKDAGGTTHKLAVIS